MNEWLGAWDVVRYFVTVGRRNVMIILFLTTLFLSLHSTSHKTIGLERIIAGKEFKTYVNGDICHGEYSFLLA